MQEVDKHQEIFTSKEAPADTVEANCSSADKIKCYLGQTVMKEDNMMGCSIYYNAQKFECLEFNSAPYSDAEGGKMKQIYCVGKYKHKESGETVTVATTHLKAKRGFEEVRTVQAKQLSEKFAEASNLIITGDMNDEPDSSAIAEFKSAYK